MDAHHWMRNRTINVFKLAQALPAGFVVLEQLLKRLEVMHRLKTRNEALHAVGQPTGNDYTQAACASIAGVLLGAKRAGETFAQDVRATQGRGVSRRASVGATSAR
jgi:hypothetical protein